VPFLILVAVAAAAGADDWLAPSLRDHLLGLGPAIMGLTIGPVLVHAHRVRRDPALLYAAVAAIAIGAVATVYLSAAAGTAYLATTRTDLGGVGERIASATPLWFAIGWLAACVALAFATPWRDRRGRRPVRAWLVASLALVVVAVGLVAAYTADLTPSQLNLAMQLLAGVTLVVGILACVRAIRAEANAYLLRWVSAAAIAFALASVVAAIVVASATEAWVRDRLADLADLGVGFQVQFSILTMTGLAFLLAGTLASERVHASRMRRATDRAAEVMGGRAEIAATIAHDVRGPVGTIKGLATTTRKSYDRLGDPERLEFIGMIEQESTRLMRLVDQVAMALKIDAGALDLTRRVQAVRPLIDQAIRAIEVGERTIEVGGDRDIAARLDTRWFIEAIAQGIDNALRFSPDVTLVTVTVSSHTDMGLVVLDIIDRGPGIPAEQRERLFEKFVRWRPAGYEDRTGTGLGLFITRGILAVHDGTAELIDGPGGGTMLRLRIPAEEERIG
jgi:signal transduction histidine kinase